MFSSLKPETTENVQAVLKTESGLNEIDETLQKSACTQLLIILLRLGWFCFCAVGQGDHTLRLMLCELFKPLVW